MSCVLVIDIMFTKFKCQFIIATVGQKIEMKNENYIRVQF